MTVQQIAGLGPALNQFLLPLGACFPECRLRDHFDIYCRGLLSNLDRKSVEPIALAAGSTVRALQLFLSQRSWDHLRLGDLLGKTERDASLYRVRTGNGPSLGPVYPRPADRQLSRRQALQATIGHRGNIRDKPSRRLGA